MSLSSLLVCVIPAVAVLLLNTAGAGASQDPTCVQDVRNEAFGSLSEAERSARCLAICTAEVNRIDGALVDVFGVWRSLDGSLLQTQSCSRYYEIRECQLGCALRINPLTDNGCRDACRQQCQGSCFPTMSCRGPCANQFNCRGSWCRAGCDTANQIDDSSDPGGVPATPGVFSVQPVLEGAGLFTVSSIDTSQLVPEEGTSVFMWRVETSTDDTLYVLQSSLTEMVDLSYFSCQTVNISLSVVNRNGSSQFTPPLSVCVHGGHPSAPQNIERVSVVDDTRPEFLGHAVITIQWDPPQERIKIVTGYSMVVIPRPLPSFPEGQCGNKTMYSIPKEATSFELRAEAVGQIPQFGPVMGIRCSYILRLQSLPASLENTVMIDLSPVLTSPRPPTVTQSCQKMTDPLTGLAGLSMSFSYEYDPLIQEAIMKFTAETQTVEPSGVPGLSVISTTYNPNLVKLNEMLTSPDCTEQNVLVNINRTIENDRVVGELSVSGLCIKEPKPSGDFSSNYILTFTSNFDQIWWRPVPMFSPCNLEGTTERPSPVLPDSIVILEDLSLVSLGASQYEVSFTVVWDPPLERYGASDYEIYVGGTPITEEDEKDFVRTTEQGQTNATLTRRVELQDEQQVYVQIRSSNGFFVSNWSSAINIIESEPPSDPGSSSLPTAVIAAIVVGVVLAVVVAVLVALAVPICLNCRRKSKFIKSLQGDTRETSFLHPRGLERVKSNKDLIRGLLPMDDEWEIPPITLDVDKQLGEGAFGEVYKGVIRGPIPGSRTMKDSIGSVVAIKYLKGKANPSERKDFVNEIEMMKRVAMGANPHVVGLIGCVTREEPLCLIIEYLKYGDLRSYLHSIKEELAMRKYVKKLNAVEDAHPDAYLDGGYDEKESGYENAPQPYVKPIKTEPSPYLKPVSAVSLPEESPYATLGDVEPVNLVSFAHQIAAGMEYLSSLEIVHRDLACRNVLVGEGKALKIADFGLSRVVSEGDAYVKTTSGRLPIKWMAIESINDRVFTVQSDVWAFGVVVWEIATLGGFPYPSIRNEELREYLLHGNRLEQPPNCADEIYEVMLRCWEENPAKRPSFSELRVTFESILMEAASYIQFSTLTDIQASKGPKTRTLPLTAKSSNPYVVNPNRTHPQGQTTPLATPTDDKTCTRTVVGVNGEPLKSPGDETPSYTTVLPSLPQ